MKHAYIRTMAVIWAFNSWKARGVLGAASTVQTFRCLSMLHAHWTSLPSTNWPLPKCGTGIQMPQWLLQAGVRRQLWRRSIATSQQQLAVHIKGYAHWCGLLLMVGMLCSQGRSQLDNQARGLTREKDGAHAADCNGGMATAVKQ